MAPPLSPHLGPPSRRPSSGTGSRRDSIGSRTRYASIQTNPMHLVLSEITAVTSAMRKNARWGASSYAAFSGLSSAYASYGTNFAGPAAGSGSTSAISAATTAVAAPSAGNANGAPGTSERGSPNLNATGLGASLGLRSGPRGEKGKESEVAASRSRSEYGYGQNEGLGLLSSFTVLRAQLRECHDFSSFPLPLLLSPFLRVILSPNTTGPITSAALQAVHKFIVYGLVSLDRPGAQLAVAEIAHATSHCRFEASEATADELVLLRILTVMRELICEPCGDAKEVYAQHTGSQAEGSRPRPQALADCLGDESICEMMETGLSMCCQMRLSDLLRRTAEQSMTAMVRVLFSRLSSIPTSEDESFSTDPNVPDKGPEHATLAADPVGEDAEMDEKKLRRMTMPDPKSRAIPAAAEVGMKEPEEAAPSGNEDGEGQEKPAEQANGENAPLLLQDGSGGPSAGKEADSGPSESKAASVADAQLGSISFAPMDTQPYGLPAIKEVLRVLVSLLDPFDAQHTDTMRLLALNMLCSVFEVAGSSMGRFPSLCGIVQDSACKHLFQLARSENPTILAFSLRTISALFETMREHLKLQHELFLSFLMDRLAPTFPLAAEPWNEVVQSAAAGRSSSIGDASARAGTPDLGPSAPPPPPPPPPMPRTSDKAPAQGEIRELMLDTLSLLFRNYQLPRTQDRMVDLWINYDCDTNSENMYERTIRFLCRAIHASNPQYPGYQESSQLLALDAILSFVSGMATRQEFENSDADWPSHYPTPESLASSKGRKAAILDGAARFNAKPKDGLAYFEKEGLIDLSGKTGTREQSIARFLNECPRLDKKLLGDYISRPDNVAVLDAFISLFDFTEKPIADAMREMLETFRLPGEAQQISRITETFAKSYFASQPSDINSEDAVYVLAYSVIMLNTDLHNPTVKRRMTADDYRKNLRGVNDGKDFNPEYLLGIYESIRRREIVMPEEHHGQLGFEYAWKELLRRSRQAGPLLESNTSVFDKAMFENSWQPIVASIAYAFSTFQDDYMLERSIAGFRQCAMLASKFGMSEIFDFMVHSLAGVTGLLDRNVPPALMNNAVVEVEGQNVTVSPLSVRFGTNFKGQLAAVVLFTIANGNGDAVRSGWTEIFEIFKNLFANSLLPEAMLQMQDFVAGQVPIPLKPKKAPGPPPQDPRTQGGGLFSTLSSYLLSPYSAASDQAAPEPTEEDIESSLCTVDCVASCKVEELFNQVKHLENEALLPAMHALRALADRQSTMKMANRSNQVDGNGTSTPTQAPMMRGQLPYDPSSVFVLEMLVSVACGAGKMIPDTWPIVFEHLSALLSSPRSYHPLLIERAVVTLLMMLQVVAEHEDLRDQVFLSLDLLRTLPAELLPATSQQLIAGLSVFLRKHATFVRSTTEWGLVLSLIGENGTTRNADAARLAFEVVAGLGRSSLTGDNYAGVLALLREFAGASEVFAQQNARDQQRKTLTEKQQLADLEAVNQERGVQAVAALEGIKSEVPRLVQASTLPYAQAWKQFWLPLMSSLAQQCLSSQRRVRQAAITHLQRVLLAPEVTPPSSSSDITSIEFDLIFDQILFPTIEELLKPAIFARDPAPGGMQETRLRASALLCKVFLHYLNQLVAQPRGLEKCWMQILEFFERFMNSGKRDPLFEAVPENLKNVLLVMHASGVLLPPPTMGMVENRTREQKALWDTTFARIERYLPRLREELFPAQEAVEGAQAGQKGSDVTGAGAAAVGEAKEKEAEKLSAETSAQPAA